MTRHVPLHHRPQASRFPFISANPPRVHDSGGASSLSGAGAPARDLDGSGSVRNCYSRPCICLLWCVTPVHDLPFMWNSVSVRNVETLFTALNPPGVTWGRTPREFFLSDVEGPGGAKPGSCTILTAKHRKPKTQPRSCCAPSALSAPVLRVLCLLRLFATGTRDAVLWTQYHQPAAPQPRIASSLITDDELLATDHWPLTTENAPESFRPLSGFS
jgi:hypothetical protein